MPNRNGRARIEAAALELFADRGVGPASTRQITRRAGVAAGTLYRHYDTKRGLAVALFLDAAGRLLAALDAAAAGSRGPAERVRQLVETFFEFAARNRSAWRYLMHGHPAVQALPRSARLPKDAVVEAVRRGIAERAFALRDPVLGAACVIGMAVRSIFFLDQGLLKRSRSAVTAEVAEAAIRALGGTSRKGRRSP